MLFAKINHAQNRRATSAPQPGMEAPVDMGMDASMEMDPYMGGGAASAAVLPEVA